MKSVAWSAADIRPLTDREFSLFQALIKKKAGIHLSTAKKALLIGRLTKRLREHGLKSFTEYYELVTEQDEAEQIRMIDSISTNETHFFREPRQFEYLEHQAVPAWIAQAERGARPRVVRVWSAGCSTGEEPFSIAMLLHTLLPPSSGWDIEILASDISTQVLNRAQQAIWPIEKIKEIPPRFLRTYMLRGVRSQAGKVRVGPDLRRLVHFMRLNLNSDPYPAGPFDAIFCRNVLIYFDQVMKTHVLRGLMDRLAPHGNLFLGHAESLTGFSERVRSVGPTIYALQEGRPRVGRDHAQ
jgi:chemotaxis protein methyltransferase CheR